MPLIATAVSRHGIVLAADPRLTSDSKQAVAGRRIFTLGFLDAAVSVSGSHTVAGEPLDRWMTSAITNYERTAEHPSLGCFVEHLRERLTELRDSIRRRVIHVAGYVRDGRHAHPEVYYLRNMRGRAPDGGYGRPGREFIVSEEFWRADYPRQELRDTLREGGAHMYLDGLPDQRIAYMLLHKRIHDFYGRVWRSSKAFRTPRSLEDIASLVELDMRIAATFLRAGDNESRRMRDSLEIQLIPAPRDVVVLS